MNNTHTPGPWKVLADPEWAGKHPLHDSRYVATGDAEFGERYEDRFGAECHDLENGHLICKMPDTQCQAGDASLIASAPELLAFVREIAGCFKSSLNNHNTIDKWIDTARDLTRDLPTPAQEAPCA